MKHSTEEYSKLLNGRLPCSTLEFELCDRLIELEREKASSGDIIPCVGDCVEYDEKQAIDFESRGEEYVVVEVLHNGYILKNDNTKEFWAGKTQVRSCR